MNTIAAVLLQCDLSESCNVLSKCKRLGHALTHVNVNHVCVITSLIVKAAIRKASENVKWLEYTMQ